VDDRNPLLAGYQRAPIARRQAILVEPPRWF